MVCGIIGFLFTGGSGLKEKQNPGAADEGAITEPSIRGRHWGQSPLISLKKAMFNIYNYCVMSITVQVLIVRHLWGPPHPTLKLSVDDIS